MQDIVKETTSQCVTCLKNNPNPIGFRLEQGVIISGGAFPGALWQTDFSEFPRKGGF